MALAITVIIESLVPLWYASMRIVSVKKRAHVKEYDYKPSISIAIPTYNEEATISRKLQNILDQSYPGKMEIFVIDGCSSDATTSIVKTFMKENPTIKLTLIQEQERGGITQAENLVFPKCNGDLVCITDADCIWGKDALNEATADFSDPRIGAVTGSRALLSKDNAAEGMEAQYNSFNETLRLGESVLDSTPIFRGELAVFRKSLLERIEIGTDSARADDSEICVKIRKMGYRAIIDKKAIFYEFAPPSMKSRMRQKLTRGGGLMRLFVNNVNIILNPKRYGWYSLIFAMNFYMLLFSPIMVLVALMLGTIFILTLPWTYFVSVVLVSLSLVVVQYIIGRNALLITIVSFLQSQLSLLLCLPLLVKRQEKTWKQVGEIREKWKQLHE